MTTFDKYNNSNFSFASIYEETWEAASKGDLRHPLRVARFEDERFSKASHEYAWLEAVKRWRGGEEFLRKVASNKATAKDFLDKAEEVFPTDGCGCWGYSPIELLETFCRIGYHRTMRWLRIQRKKYSRVDGRDRKSVV